MKKKIYVMGYKPGFSYPFASETYEGIMQSNFNPERHTLIEVSVDVPDPDQIVEGKEIQQSTP